MKYLKFKAHYAFCLLLFLFASVFTQIANSPVSDWARVVSPKADFSIDIPPTDWIVDNEDSRFRIYRYTNGNSVTISVHQTSNAKEEFQLRRRFMTGEDQYKFFKSGDFFVQQYDGNEEQSEETKDRSGSYMWLLIASSKGEYSVSVSTKDAENDFFGKVLRSIRLNGKELFKGDSNEIKIRETISIDSLKTDSRVIAALRRPDSRQTDLIISPGEKLEKPDYDRGLILLRKVKAVYTNSARSRGIRGTVTLHVTFLANGELGPMKLVKSLDRDLDKAALDAAKKFKFLPAENGGKTVDVTRRVVYTFNVY